MMNTHPPGEVTHSTDFKHLLCSHVHEVAPPARCDWIRNTSDCYQSQDAIFNYFEFLYCTMETSLLAGVCVLILWLLVFFVILGTTADNFFCPSLTVIAKLFHLSESVAGVTVLAFGNGAPDIFTSLAGLPTGHGELIFSQLMGGGIFVTTVVVGLICIYCPFEMQGKHFLRDDLFYMLAVIWTFFVFSTKSIRVLETSGFIIIYICYITVVLMTRQIKRRHAMRDLHSSSSPELTLYISGIRHNSDVHKANTDHHHLAVPDIRITAPDGEDITAAPPSTITIATLLSVQSNASLAMHRVDNGDPSPSNSSRGSKNESTGTFSSQYTIRTALYNIVIQPALPIRHSSTSTNTIGDLAVQAERIMKLSMLNEKALVGNELMYRTLSQTSVHFHKQQGMLQLFLHEMNVFYIEDWNNTAWYMKIVAVVQIPILLVLKLLIPVVNLTAVNHGWCKLLNILHCVIVPLFATFITGAAKKNIFKGIPLWSIVLVFGICLATAVFFTSNCHKPPNYHDFFSLMGFVGSILVIFIVAHEVVSILQTVGIILKISEATLGLTILAWGNSLGDLIANVTIAKLGHPKMGFSACFGGGPLSILLGIGISSTYGLIKGSKNEIIVGYGRLGPTCVTFLMLSLVSSIIVLPLTSFQARRQYGFFLITLYVMFLFVVLLSELNIIHSLNIPC